MTSDISRLMRREAYPVQLDHPIRYGDMDSNGHVNNAVFATYFETGRTEMFADPTLWVSEPDAAWVLARIVINFASELHYPGRVTLATGIGRIGTSSILHYQGVFSGETCAAHGEATVVQINRTTRKSMPLSPAQRAALDKLMMRAEL